MTEVKEEDGVERTNEAIEFAKWLRLAEWQNITKVLFKKGDYEKLYRIFKEGGLKNSEQDKITEKIKGW